ncbi:MAG: tRNA 2-thiouridine(34) synthase MnmA [Bacteroidota bacterium]
MKRVVVGLSGGVDSSVAAYLLKEQGYDVVGLFMKNWHDESVIIANECPWVEDSNDAMLVAQSLGIPFQVIDLSEQYKERIVDYMFAEYEAGRTPNPDVLCNREIKFDVFLKTALNLGADYVATGHYCRKAETELNGEKVYRLLAGKDNNKDQSYFLCQVSQEQMSKALFPIGELEKSEVRKIAAEQGLITADKKDSQGLCFVGKVRLPEFLQQKLEPKTGEIVEIPAEAVHQYNGSATTETMVAPHEFNRDMGKVVGEHRGAHYFTVGQRKGLNVGGTPLPLFVLGTDVNENLIYTGQGENHPGLYRKGLSVDNTEVHWVRADLKMKSGETRDYMARIRYRQPLEEAQLIQEENELKVIFKNPQRGVAAGQFVAWYDGDELIGSGVIS